MGRFIKESLDYFPVLCSEEAGMDFIEAKFGMAGYGTIIRLMKKIYGLKGYYCVWDEDLALIFSKDIAEKQSFVEEVVSEALKRDIFSKEMYEKYSVLTSRSIQMTYVTAASRRDKVVIKNDYLMLNEDELPKNVCINNDSVDEYVDIKAKDSRKKTQRKEEKRREYKTKEEYSIVKNTPQAPTHEGGGSGDNPSVDDDLSGEGPDFHEYEYEYENERTKQDALFGLKSSLSFCSEESMADKQDLSGAMRIEGKVNEGSVFHEEPTLEEIHDYVKEKGYIYVDWNWFYKYYSEKVGWQNVDDWRKVLEKWNRKDMIKRLTELNRLDQSGNIAVEEEFSEYELRGFEELDRFWEECLKRGEVTDDEL